MYLNTALHSNNSQPCFPGCNLTLITENNFVTLFGHFVGLLALTVYILTSIPLYIIHLYTSCTKNTSCFHILLYIIFDFIVVYSVINNYIETVNDLILCDLTIYGSVW